MRICIVTGGGYPCDIPPNYGGVQIATQNLAKELILAGHEVHVIAKSYKIYDMYDENGVHIHFLGFRYKEKSHYFVGADLIKNVIYNILVFQMICKLNPDIVHCQYISSAIPAYFVKKIKKIPYIIVKHNGGVLNKILKKMPYLKSVSEFITLTNSDKKKVDDILSVQSKIIPNGVDTQLFKPADEYSSKKIILCVSRISQSKGILDVVSSLKLVLKKEPFVKLYLVGDGPELEYVKHYIQTEQLSDSIILTGWRAPKETIQYYQSAMIFIMPSHMESFCMTLLEASAVGLPLISTPVGIAPDLIDTWNNGELVPINNPEVLANTIINMINNKEKLRIYHEQSLKAVSTYSWKYVADQYLQVYNKIIDVARKNDNDDML